MTAAHAPQRKVPKRITAAYLERAALFHLERFAASSERLRRVLNRKVLRAARHHGDDPAEGQALVEALITRFAESGLLDDALYARGKAVSLRRRGGSGRMIAARLAQDGIDEATRNTALAEADDETGDTPDPELTAARALLRRRRLGSYRRNRDGDTDRKDLATLARAGFSFDIAKAALALDRTAAEPHTVSPDPDPDFPDA